MQATESLLKDTQQLGYLLLYMVSLVVGGSRVSSWVKALGQILKGIPPHGHQMVATAPHTTSVTNHVLGRQEGASP